MSAWSLPEYGIALKASAFLITRSCGFSSTPLPVQIASSYESTMLGEILPTFPLKGDRQIITVGNDQFRHMYLIRLDIEICEEMLWSRGFFSSNAGVSILTTFSILASLFALFSRLRDFTEVVLCRELSWPLDKSSKGFRALFVTLDSPPALVTVEKLGNSLLEKSTVFDDVLGTDWSFSSTGFSRSSIDVDERAIILKK